MISKQQRLQRKALRPWKAHLQVECREITTVFTVQPPLAEFKALSLHNSDTAFNLCCPTSHSAATTVISHIAPILQTQCCNLPKNPKVSLISLLYGCSTTSGDWKTYWKQAQKHLFCVLPWILLLCLKSERVLLEADLQEFLFCHLLGECWDTAEQLNAFPHPSLTKAWLKRT